MICYVRSIHKHALDIIWILDIISMEFEEYHALLQKAWSLDEECMIAPVQNFKKI